MYKLIYSSTAEKDLVAIFNYISDDSKDRAIKYMSEIENSILSLLDFPKIGNISRFEELRMQGIYVLPHDSYLIFYRINEKDARIEIVRVLHGSRDYAKLF